MEDASPVCGRASVRRRNQCKARSTAVDDKCPLCFGSSASDWGAGLSVRDTDAASIPLQVSIWKCSDITAGLYAGRKDDWAAWPCSWGILSLTAMSSANDQTGFVAPIDNHRSCSRRDALTLITNLLSKYNQFR